jgi:hypothetical protein
VYLVSVVEINYLYVSLLYITSNLPGFCRKVNFSVCFGRFQLAWKAKAMNESQHSALNKYILWFSCLQEKEHCD